MLQYLLRQPVSCTDGQARQIGGLVNPVERFEPTDAKLEASVGAIEPVLRDSVYAVAVNHRLTYWNS